MEENRQMTMKEALIYTRNILTNIQVPITMKESVIDPVWSAICNLNLCINTIQNAEISESQNKANEDPVPVKVEEIGAKQGE